MKIFGICLIKNEADIIEYIMKKHSEWADKLFIYDNGSTDNTWEIVLELAKHNPKIVPFKKEAKPYQDGLRSEVFNHYKHLASDGDWWCVKCDSDEVYIDDPREVLSKISKFHHVVASMHFEYRLTFEDVDELTFDKSIEEQINQLKYYHKQQNCEFRFVKHRKRLVWPDGEEAGHPRNRGIMDAVRIRLKHYQYRSPTQIQDRILIRKIATESGYKFFKRDDVDQWEEKLVSRTQCIFDDGSFKTGHIRDKNKTPLVRLILLYILHGLKILP